MNFLRRVLGLSSDANITPTEEGIHITQGQSPSLTTMPEESVVVTPPPSSNVVANKSDTAPAAPVPTKEMAQTKVEVGTRPLPPLEVVVPVPGQRLQFGQLSNVGMVRSNNQDSILSIVASTTSNDQLPDFGLFIVADGMGGHLEGERASAIATRIVARHVISEIYGAILDQQMNDPERPSIAEVLRAAVQKANDAVTEEIPDGGTTVTVTVVLGDMAYIAHVGDSRAYMITDDGIEQITRDHSLVQRLIELDQLTPEEAPDHPQRNVLYRALGQSDSLDVDAITRRLPPRARLLLCSDGLWNMVSEDHIQAVLAKHHQAQTACEELVKMANDRGGPDNISMIVVQVPG
ncbi:MAG: Stp1/IreP family PP2C-type Ser/Thr phosphatase [Chloroflexi bacterium]|nr:Stp1/IreP family PP2C-type Ser/Thr phosphatase [Chloroflexota bacterium]